MWVQLEWSQATSICGYVCEKNLNSCLPCIINLSAPGGCIIAARTFDTGVRKPLLTGGVHRELTKTTYSGISSLRYGMLGVPRSLCLSPVCCIHESSKTSGMVVLQRTKCITPPPPPSPPISELGN